MTFQNIDLSSWDNLNNQPTLPYLRLYAAVAQVCVSNFADLYLRVMFRIYNSR
jgi:hypothetical protein